MISEFARPLILYPLLCAAVYYLVNQATITRPLWSRYPRILGEFLGCPACLGFWLGLGCASLGHWQGWEFLGIGGWITYPILGLCSIIWTPPVVRAHTNSMIYDDDEA
jgi:hypothetical protein